MWDEKPTVINGVHMVDPVVSHPSEDMYNPHDPVTKLEVKQVEHELHEVVDDRIDDPNMDPGFVRAAEEAMEEGDIKHEVELGQLLEEDSPYPEVRSSISNVDDPDMPVLTFRSMLLGLITVIVVPGLNQFLYLRFPSTTITPYVITIVVYPFGQFMAWCLPRWTWHTRIGKITLNDGPFNVKEHSLISIMGLMSYQSAYAAGIPAVQKIPYHMQDWGYGYGILLILSTQLLGLSFATFCRRFLVWPASMIWPNNLPRAALLNSMHGIKTDTFTGMSRIKFFWIMFAILFCYQFFPTYIFVMLSIGNWFTVIAPKNVVLNQMLGTQSGLGLLPFTFDWTVISYAIAPLATPWWTQANVLVGYVIFYVIVCTAMYYTNVWNAKYLPMFSTSSYDRFGKKYDVSRVVQKMVPGSMSAPMFDAEAYNNYSLIYLPSALTVSYFLSFASVTAVLVHVGLFHGKQIWHQVRSNPLSANDVHMRLMSKYKETFFYWYFALFLAAFGMGIGAVEGWPTDHPWWAFIVAIVIGVVFLLPIGTIMAISNQEVGLNMISELIIGYMLPGRPIAMMIFKTTMYMITYQGIQFLQDQKLAHYMKIPPRIVFGAQVFATIVGGCVQLAVQDWAFSNINDICQPNQANKFNCASYTVFGTASIIWGLIGPGNMFSPGKKYNDLMWGFLVGAVAPIPIWLLAKKFPKGRFHLINLPVLFTGTGLIPPATGVNYLSPIAIGFLTQYLWKRYRFKSWFKYNYILSAALDGASAIGVVFIFFVLQYVHGQNENAPNQHFYLNGWWGNTAPFSTLDGGAEFDDIPHFAVYQLAKGEAFEGTPLQVGLPAT